MTETKIPMHEKVTVSIEQHLGANDRFIQCRDQDDYFQESQERIGFVVGQAVRGILAQQNCGDASLFWTAFLNELLNEHFGGGQWSYRLLCHARKWVESQSRKDGSESFDNWMCRLLKENP
jgi:hypothetical protein